MFIVLLSSIVNTSNHIKCVSLSNQKCEIQPTLINLHPNEYCQEFQYYPFLVKLDRCFGSCNTVIDLSNKICIPNKIGKLNLTVFNMITGINESKTLTKCLSCELTVDLMEKNVIQINGGITINVDVSVKKIMYVKKIVWNCATCISENGKYLASIMDDSMTTCDEVIKSHEEELKTIPSNFNEKKATCTTQFFFILCVFINYYNIDSC